jgi:hypothetical protein
LINIFLFKLQLKLKKCCGIVKGLNAAIRALASTAKPQLEVTIDEHTEEWTMHIHNIPSGSHEMVINFKLDEDTDITWPDGRHIKVQ